MGIYSGFKYGSGVVYGASTEVYSVGPENSGPSPGGNKFTITGEGFDPRQWDDSFEGASLDTSKWLDISDSGTISTGVEHLLFSTGIVAGSSAGVQSVSQWQNVQGEIRAVLLDTSVYPISGVIACRFSLVVDASNYSTIIVSFSEQGAYSLSCETWVGGLLADRILQPIDWSSGSCILRILRWGSTVYFIANGSVIWSTSKVATGISKFQILSDNTTQAYDISLLKIEHFYFRPFAVFQDQPVYNTVVVSNGRLRGIVPPSKDVNLQDGAYQGLVSVSVVGNHLASLVNAYEYYYVKGLKTINDIQFGVVLDVVNDAQLETPEGYNKGLGGGY